MKINHSLSPAYNDTARKQKTHQADECYVINKKVQVGKDQEKAQSERDSHSKNRGGKKPN